MFQILFLRLLFGIVMFWSLINMNLKFYVKIKYVDNKSYK